MLGHSALLPSCLFKILTLPELDIFRERALGYAIESHQMMSADSGTSWSAAIGVIGTLGGMIVGFALNELSYVLRTRREDRRILGRALAELLEIKHYVEAMPTVMKAVRAAGQNLIPPEAELALRNIFETFFPHFDSLQKRYEDAVSSVSGPFPVLAFRLRAKDSLTPILGKVRGMIPAEPAAAHLWLQMEDQIVQESIPLLKQLILEMAKLHGRSTYRAVCSTLSKSGELPKELSDLLARMIAQAQAAGMAATDRPSKGPAQGPTTP